MNIKNTDIIIFIDSYISDIERSTECYKLIKKIRDVFPDYKIGLINKYPDSFKLDSLVDYYFYYGDSIMVGEPPKHLLNEGLYERGFVYKDIGVAIVENWVPLTGVTDHVASIYNSFIITSRIARSLGFKKVFKVEYDTDFDLDELKSMKEDINNFKDYLLHGSRNERNDKKIVDVHTIGYSVDLFNGFDPILDDESWWKLCKKIGYYGKWIEYVISCIIEYQKNNNKLEGIVYKGECCVNFPKTQFDTINSPGLWSGIWEDMPKICNDWIDDVKVAGNLILFYYNNGSTDLDVKCIITNSKNKEIYNLNLKMHPHSWHWESINVNEEIQIKKINTKEGKVETSVNTYTPEDVNNLNIRFKRR